MIRLIFLSLNPRLTPRFFFNVVKTTTNGCLDMEKMKGKKREKKRKPCINTVNRDYGHFFNLVLIKIN